MKEYVNVQNYAPIISNRRVGEEIYQLIMSRNPLSNEVEVDLDKIKSMTTYCARQIFGQLYLDLGPERFSKNIIILNATEDVQLIIKLGIKYAIEYSHRYS